MCTVAAVEVRWQAHASLYGGCTSEPFEISSRRKISFFEYVSVWSCNLNKNDERFIRNRTL